MKIVFMGTSEFAVPSLQIIADNFEVAAVITQPDRPKGRGHKIESPPVKLAAMQRSLPVYQYTRIKDGEAVQLISSLHPDLIVVVSYGQLIPTDILNIPVHGCINVHASLLPRYRGAAPIQRAIMAGEATTGVTTMFMNEGLDTGDIILQTAVEIPLNMNAGALEKVLAQAGAELLLQTIQQVQAGTVRPIVQDNSQATYATMIQPEDEIINWSDSAWDIHNKIRALDPKPGAYTTYNGNKLKIFTSRVHEHENTARPGEIITKTQEGFLVQTGQGYLEILEVQKAGKKRMLAKEFLKGIRLDAGEQLGN
ncbi:MAG TPA: methionyl-tRNA formyltransferase [Syntrophomonadaceae bacterium]|nr:methionyl-tRNA formyltransferase [Syntrophomonadaceae bacterium]HQE22533.1 methionyl-tRNA formyltransferase [Syntrophomonadaceae bacterium]